MLSTPRALNLMPGENTAEGIFRRHEQRDYQFAMNTLLGSFLLTVQCTEAGSPFVGAWQAK
jgi:hypothetical protein